MASKEVNLSNSSYTKLDTASGSVVDIQNTSFSDIKVVFSLMQPDINTKAYYIIKPLEIFLRNGKTGDMYAMSEDGDVSIVVGE